MTGHTSDEHSDSPQENHSDAESLRNIPSGHDQRGVVQDQPGTHGDTVEHAHDSPDQNDADGGTIGGTLDDDLTARG